MNFIDLQEQYRRYKSEINDEMSKVLDSAHFIMGKNITELEKELAEYTGSKYAVACSSGTDAILLSLMALNVRQGDEIIVPDFTFFATAEMISFIGAKPIFIDVNEDTYNIDTDLIKKKITEKTKGIIAVSLFGQCADFDELNEICNRHDLFLIEDAAQSFGATYKEKKSGNLSEIATTSFFPAKPLGCYGDGGAIFTDKRGINDKIRMLLNHGQNERYKHKLIGINGRLDSLQAAILRVKLKHFDDELNMRQDIAYWYNEALGKAVKTPVIEKWNKSAWAQYTVRSGKRENIIEHLTKRGIPTAIHYPIPLHNQEAFSDIGVNDRDFPISNMVSQQVFSLPMHPFLKHEEVLRIADEIKEAVR